MRTYLAVAGLKNEQQSTSERENDLRETSFHISNDNAPSFLPSSLLFTHSSHFLLRSVFDTEQRSFVGGVMNLSRMGDVSFVRPPFA